MKLNLRKQWDGDDYSEEYIPTTTQGYQREEDALVVDVKYNCNGDIVLERCGTCGYYERWVVKKYEEQYGKDL